jgi:hypothetical protein
MNTEEEHRPSREQSQEMSRRIREAGGFTGDATVRDTEGNVVRDATGRFVKPTGQGMDGGSRGGEVPRDVTSEDMSSAIRQALENGRRG